MVRDRRIKLRGSMYREVDKRYFERMKLKIRTATIVLTSKKLRRRVLYFAECLPLTTV